MLAFLHENCSVVEAAVKGSGDLSDENAERLIESINNFKESF